MVEKKDFAIEEQTKVLQNSKKNMIVSASAGSGKTFVMIKYITELVCERKIPIKNLVVLTYTKVAAAEMKERLEKSLKKQKSSPYIIEQIDSLATANISTIDSFCEKNLKKYANLIGLNENFTILDEHMQQKIKDIAYEKALERFSDDLPEDFAFLMEIFKNDKEKLQKIIVKIEDLASAVEDREGFIQENTENAEMFFDKATSFLIDYFKQNLSFRMKQIDSLHINDYSFEWHKRFDDVLKCEDIVTLTEKLSDIEYPRKPAKKLIGEEASSFIDFVVKETRKSVSQITDVGLVSKEVFEEQRQGTLEKTILKLFDVYQKTEDEEKLMRNALSFSDLSKYMLKLSQRTNLFEGIAYVFVDEYQDTNKAHGRIIKNIAKNSNFVAVGDVKQGIYGFRLASCEIFLKDVKDFEEDEDSAVNYLKENFRSDQRVLDFVNDVFKVCMTKEETGVDYEESSMLHAFNRFESDGQKAVTIHLVKKPEKEQEKVPDLYSVKDASVSLSNSDIKQILDIKNSIQDMLGTKIFDDGKFRDCEYGDIAILSRNRNSLYYALQDCLIESGVPVVSDAKKKLADEVEIKVLINFLKLALNIDDDIAMLSVLLSPIGNFELEEIIKQKNEKTLCENVKTNEIFASVIKKIDNFAQNMLLFGAKRAFDKLFDETNYRSYINLKENGRELNLFVDEFLRNVEESGFNFDLPGLINYFETVEIDVAPQSEEENAVKLITIHGSKGLEYPVVFLIDCDGGLFSGNKEKVNDVKIDENFGFAVKSFDVDNNENSVSARMQAINIFGKRKQFVEELMIFYVALTRAKNRLMLFGNFDKNCFDKKDLFSCNNYFSFIFYALKDVAQQVAENGTYEGENLQIKVLDDFEDRTLSSKQSKDYAEFSKEDYEKIKDYLDFEYKYDDKLNFKLKETVTELNKWQSEDKTEHFSNDSFSFGGAGVEIGNAYHLALKLFDFSKIEKVEDVEAQIEKNSLLLGDGKNLLDSEVLFRNIMLVKQVAGDGTLYKEKPFILKEKLCNLLDEIKFDDEIMVQGVVDLFVVKKDEVVLIDYKYSNAKNEQYLIDKYKKQLKFYKIALENVVDLPIKQTYLLSLKSAKLIRVDL
ncbi:MAG: UvrD-helicase domain-containing protein [Clostridia bacterium]|nr:UvrD-helicase domain-containing protein [Clostridia bacterium]